MLYVETANDEIWKTECSEFVTMGSDCESKTTLLMTELASFNATIDELRKQVMLCKTLPEQTFFRQYVKVLLERFKNLAQSVCV